MTCSTDRLTSLLPRFMWSMTIRSEDHGYRLAWRHAHIGGMMCDCPEEVYSNLTFNEMADVIDVLTDSVRYAGEASSSV